VAGFLVLLLVAACSGSGGEALPSLTATPTRTGSFTAPSLSLPESTTAITDRESASRNPEQSDNAKAPSQSAEVSDRSPSAEVSDPAVPAATTPAEPSNSESVSTWWPWALLTLVAVAVILALWQRRRALRRDQRVSREVALAEARWLGHEALPTLLSAPSAERRGAWRMIRPRVAALEQQVAGATATGSEFAVTPDAQRLLRAVTAVRAALDDDVMASGADAAAEAHGAAKQAARQLDQVLSELLTSDRSATH